MFIVMLS